MPPTISLSALVLGQEKITPFCAHVTVVHQCLITVTFANIEKQTYFHTFCWEKASYDSNVNVCMEHFHLGVYEIKTDKKKFKRMLI